MAPTELQLRYLTELTRLVLKGHADHFVAEDYFHEGLGRWVTGEDT